MIKSSHNLTKMNIAVVSVGGVFPGSIDSQSFINNILEQKDLVAEIPSSRWAASQHIMISKDPCPDSALCHRAGLIKETGFNPDDFLVENSLLAALDPVHHLVLATGKQAVSSCSLSLEQKKRTGVILGALCLPTETVSVLSNKILTNDFHSFENSITPIQGLASSVVSCPASVLSRSLGFSGGSFTVDGACASSLVALKLACEQLIFNRADVMLTGGVSRPDSLYTQVGFSQLSALSPTGQCSPFDKNANGLVVGEGCGILVLKRLEDALNDKDKILGVIKGVGVSNDIEGSLVAPASEGQLRAMILAFDQAGWQPDQIQYMECHGTGTPLGDLVESTSIVNLINHYGTQNASFSIGSVKSMIGHLLTAAGAAALIKTLLSMNEKVLPPSLHFTEFSDKNPLHSSQVNVQTKKDSWDPVSTNISRKAGVSAFGFGGVNAHVLIEEFKKTSKSYQLSVSKSSSDSFDMAVVGMGIQTEGCSELSDLYDLMSGKKQAIPKDLVAHWKNFGFSNEKFANLKGFPLGTVSLDPRKFHIPPLMIPDILPQQLVALKVAQKALVNGNISPRPSKKSLKRTRFGCVVGIDFDCKSANFFSRWVGKDQNRSKDFIESFGPPLNFDRTLGSLGGIVASRMAKEFQLGGPCFTMSAGAVSAMNALEIARFSLETKETDVFLCVCVDMGLDPRSFLINNAQEDFGSVFPSEGAGAMVLKSLAKAKKDGDTIFAVIKGISSLSGGSLPGEHSVDGQVHYLNNLDQLWKISKITPDEVSVFTTHGMGTGRIGILEKKALDQFIDHRPSSAPPLSVDSTMSILGDARTASGMFALIKTCMGIHYKIYSHGKPAYLPTNAVVAAVSPDGNCGHALLQAPEKSQTSFQDIGLQVENKKQSLISSLPKINSSEKLLSGTAAAHERFLEFSKINMKLIESHFGDIASYIATGKSLPKPSVQPLLDRDQCLEFAIGKTGNVLGPEFDIVDTYPVRVRLPAEPLMLVDRVMDIKGKPLSLGSGKIITQHDVGSSAWYMDGPKAPVSITIEAGQADLLLCHYLGIDHMVQGKRKYRLLDAKVTFHRSLPCAGEIIEYHIEIDRFLKQGDTYLFFFHYTGYIGSQLVISMKDGCAGFFNDEEVKHSGGIVLKKEEKQLVDSVRNLLPCLAEIKPCSFNEKCISALRKGDLQTAFGNDFSGMKLGQYQCLPGGKMHLIDRVTQFIPQGGRFGKGRIVAELDIHPEDWFLTCHFIDDHVMPGTLMYECCAHTLRVFVQRFGWVSPDDSVYFDVLPGNQSDLKCRGPVTCETNITRYEIDIKEMGYDPEPFVIADAHMFSDDLHIVYYQNMGMRLVGVDRKTLEQIWRKK